MTQGAYFISHLLERQNLTQSSLKKKQKKRKKLEREREREKGTPPFLKTLSIGTAHTPIFLFSVTPISPASPPSSFAGQAKFSHHDSKWGRGTWSIFSVSGGAGRATVSRIVASGRGRMAIIYWLNELLADI